MPDWCFLNVLMGAGEESVEGTCAPVFCGLWGQGPGGHSYIPSPAPGLSYNRCSINWCLKGKQKQSELDRKFLSCICSAYVTTPKSRLSGEARLFLSCAWILCITALPLPPAQEYLHGDSFRERKRTSPPEFLEQNLKAILGWGWDGVGLELQALDENGGGWKWSLGGAGIAAVSWWGDRDGANKQTETFPLNFRGLLCVSNWGGESSSGLRGWDGSRLRSLGFQWPQEARKGTRWLRAGPAPAGTGDTGVGWTQIWETVGGKKEVVNRCFMVLKRRVENVILPSALPWGRGMGMR